MSDLKPTQTTRARSGEMDEVGLAKLIADTIERADSQIEFADWNDLGEVTVRTHRRTFRMTVRDITAEPQT